MPYPAKTDADTILASALNLLEQRGADALTMRSLATTLGLSVSSLYRHYMDRTALEAALGDEGSRLLLERLREATGQLAPREAVTALAHAYLDFARSRPALYDLLMAPRAPTLAAPGPGKELWTFVLAQVGGVTRRPDDTAAAVAVWSFLHGFVSLERGGLFGSSGPQGALTRGLDALITGFEAKTP